jgi:hypothetical protein
MEHDMRKAAWLVVAGTTCLPLLMVVEREMQIDHISILTNLLSVLR